jgi:hypothetical protein
MDNLVDLELAKRLKAEGYSIPCEYYWLDIDLPFSASGLKRMKDGEKMNHNAYDEFVYSAPLEEDAIKWLHGKSIQYLSSIMVKLRRK